MPIFIKTGLWEKASKSFKGWLNLDDHINSVVQNSISTDDIAAIQAANSPSATNAFATMDDITAITVVQVTGLTLLSTGWSLVSGLYEYDLADSNITATSSVDVIPDNADHSTVVDADVLPKTVSSAGSVKIYATYQPTANIGVTINITKVI